MLHRVRNGLLGPDDQIYPLAYIFTMQNMMLLGGLFHVLCAHIDCPFYRTHATLFLLLGSLGTHKTEDGV